MHLNRLILKSKFLLAFFLTAAILSGCGDDQPDSNRNVSRPSLDKDKPAIRVKMKNQGTLIYGDTIVMDIESVKSAHVLESVSVELVDQDRVVATANDGHLVIPTSKTGGGDFRIRIKGNFEGGQTGSRYKMLHVVAPEPPQSWHFEVLDRYPHDSKSYTQGLLVHDGYIYEGSGTYGGSHIRKQELRTGKVLKEKKLSSDFFGEGITVFEGKVYQLTYKAARAFAYDLETFENVGEFPYNFNTSEGWGLTNNDTALIASDGSAMLYFINPDDFRTVGHLRVFDTNGSVNQLNELEYHNGLIYANIYTTARIVAIDPESGMVVQSYSAAGIMRRSEATANMDVLNGIAFNPLNGHFLITGKNWSTLYEVRPVKQAS